MYLLTHYLNFYYKEFYLKKLMKAIEYSILKSNKVRKALRAGSTIVKGEQAIERDIMLGPGSYMIPQLAMW